jgi:hypothetical protein
MRFALFLINLAVFKDLYLKQVFRATVRPWCHLILRQQTWQEKLNSVVVDGLRMWESRKRFSKPGFTGVICRPVKLRRLAPPTPYVPAYWPVRRWRCCGANHRIPPPPPSGVTTRALLCRPRKSRGR